MIVKLIQCAVLDGKVSQFSEGQKAWEILRSAPGFITQIGGWGSQKDNRAIILGFWESYTAYQNFMADIHDEIFESNNQAGTYDPSQSQISLWITEDASQDINADVAVKPAQDQFIAHLLQAEFFSYYLADRPLPIDGCLLMVRQYNPDINAHTIRYLNISTQQCAKSTGVLIEHDWLVTAKH